MTFYGTFLLSSNWALHGGTASTNRETIVRSTEHSSLVNLCMCRRWKGSVKIYLNEMECDVKLIYLAQDKETS